MFDGGGQAGDESARERSRRGSFFRRVQFCSVFALPPSTDATITSRSMRVNNKRCCRRRRHHRFCSCAARRRQRPQRRRRRRRSRRRRVEDGENARAHLAKMPKNGNHERQRSCRGVSVVVCVSGARVFSRPTRRDECQQARLPFKASGRSRAPLLNGRIVAATAATAAASIALVFIEVSERATSRRRQRKSA